MARPIIFDLTEQPEHLPHHWEECVGSGHAALGLRRDWQDQLQQCQRELGMRRVRFHGILCDDMGTHISQSGKSIDSFHNPDLVVAAILAAGMSPFIEWSFMPRALASGTATVFSYAGNITPPAQVSAWTDLIVRLTAHWLSLYGIDELQRWRFEVWNEPNLPAFWTGGQERYFDLYHHTACAIKGVDARLQVGGPATAKNAWIGEFAAACASRRSPLDFISTHHYPTDAFGNQAQDITEQLARSSRNTLHDQARAARAEAGGLPLNYTEWSITSSPDDVQHDQPIAAAYAIHAIMGVRGIVDAYSYWTFSDIFAENYFPSRPFHGGFGLLTLHGIPKPVYRAFALLHRLGHELWQVDSGHPTVDTWVIRNGKSLVLLAVQLVLPGHAGSTVNLSIRIDHCPEPLSCHIERIDEEHANPQRCWIDMGSPGHLDARSRDRLVASAQPATSPHPFTYHEHSITVAVDVPANAVVAVTWEFATSSILFSPPSVDHRLAQLDEAELLTSLQRQAFSYFLFTANLDNGLVPDSTQPGSPASIGATGFALASYPVAIQRGFISRQEGAKRTLTALRFLARGEQGEKRDASGYRGFFYHFLDMDSGRRTRDSELSTIDTALLVAGALVAAAYFDRDELAETEVRRYADQLYHGVEWTWARDQQLILQHGWKPESGFLAGRWNSYSEALLLYVLAAGSPTHGLDGGSYAAFSSGFALRTYGDITYLHAGPLFIHQYAHCFADLRGIRDRFMREHDSDYFENSRRAALVQQRYCMANPLGFACYGPLCWGITASDGPGEVHHTVNGRDQEFFGYRARGAPDGPDDGTIAPWATLASLPFAPDIVLPAIRHILDLNIHRNSRHGFRSTFNLTYPEPGGWVGPYHLGINQGPAVIMVENHRSGMIWQLMQRHPDIVRGLRRCGFSGGYLAGEG